MTQFLISLSCNFYFFLILYLLFKIKFRNDFSAFRNEKTAIFETFFISDFHKNERNSYNGTNVDQIKHLEWILIPVNIT
jgi:hypothetical protein